VALFLSDRSGLLAPAPSKAPGELAARIRGLLGERGALFFPDLAAETGAFSGDLVEALWELVWSGEVANDTLAPLRSMLSAASARSARRSRGRAFRSRRLGPPGSEGRWSLVPRAARRPPSETERRMARVRSLLDRYGVVTREGAAAEGLEGGFSSVYPVLKAMEEAGQVRRGYFVAGLGATQFALPGADDRLRGLREAPDADTSQTLVLAATDPANPYGAALRWPSAEAGEARPQRAAGAQVVLRDGELLAWIGRAESSLLTFLPAEEPAHGKAARDLARALAALVEGGRRRAVLVSRVDGADARDSPLAPHLAEAGFFSASRGFLKRMSPRAEVR